MQISDLMIEPVAALWFPLVKKFYQEHYPSGKPNKSEPIWVIRYNTKILCAVRLKPFHHAQLLTSMVTKPDYRNLGLGKKLLLSLNEELNKTPTYCFAFTHLINFYPQTGFIEVQAHDLPEELTKRYFAYKNQGRDIIPMLFQGNKQT